MRCEVVAIGSELLLGQIVDTNSSWIGEQLALAGIDSHFQVKVGDNLERMISTLELALSRSEAVIVCGGLGPTPDDITRDAIAHIMDVEMERHEHIVDRIERRFARRGRAMPENNKRQADVPIGASIIEQMPGTAPGLVCPVDDKVLYAVPGVPYEMREMMQGTILPDLRRRAGLSAVIKSRVLRTWGNSESGLAEDLAKRIEALDATGNPTIAFLASGIEGIKVRITAKGESEPEADALLDAEEANIRQVLGDIVFGVDDQNMEAAVLELLADRAMTLAVAESLSGGLMASRITSVAGAGNVFRGGLVVQTSDLAAAHLGAAEGSLVSAEAAKAMAEGVRRLLDTDVGLATTGVGGPDEEEGQPAGTVYIAVSVGEDLDARHLRLTGDRERIRQYAVISLLDFLRRKLIGADHEVFAEVKQ